MNLLVDINLNKDKTLYENLREQMFSDSLINKIKRTPNSLFFGDKNISYDSNLKLEGLLTIILPNEETKINRISGDLNIVYEDDYLLILNKPHNLAVIGTIAHYNYHLSGMIIDYFIKQKLSSTVHYVNRLDKDTSGLIIIAKHQYIHALMSKVKIEKKYRLLVQGKLEEKEGTLSYKIKKDDSFRSTKYYVDDNGVEAITEYKLIKYIKECSDIEATLVTGKTHQLRVQFSYLGYPILGDVIYGDKNSSNYLHLQSYYVGFRHPITHKLLKFSLPKEW